ncbi:MAG: protein kinase domain-containing protein, partial [Planctomycetota bacterium]
MAREGEVSSVECGVSSPETDSKHSPLDTKHSSHTDLAPLLTDFSLAKDAASETRVTRSGVTLGTPNYMPPEQADGRLEEIDVRSDVYGLGATLYEMLTLQPPFEGDSTAEIIKKIFFAEPVPPRRLNRLVEKDLETICLKCLEKDPSRRYETAKQLGADLGRFLEGRPILARPVSAFEKLLRRAKRNKAAASILVVLALVLAGGSVAGFFGLRHWKRTSDERAKAESEREDAEEGAGVALAMLEKGKRVSVVLRAANAELKAVLKELQDSYYSTATKEVKKKTGSLVWGSVEDFGKSVAQDSASRAAWLAVKGWLRHLGGDEDGAMELFSRSRGADGDVATGDLFESMLWLSRYLDAQKLPEGVMREIRVSFPPVPGQTKSGREAREKLERLLKDIRSARVWGEAASENFEQVVSGFTAVWEGRLGEAERGLTTALSIPEMEWMRGEILLARAKVKMLQVKLEAAGEDFTRVARLQPNNPKPLYHIGVVSVSLAVLAVGKGEDPFPLLEKGIESFSRVLEFRDWWALAATYCERGNAHSTLHEYRTNRGLDGEDAFRRSLRDFGEALRRIPGYGPAHRGRGTAYVKRAQEQAMRGRDPRPAYGSAILDFDKAVAAEPKSFLALGNRADAYGYLAKYLAREKMDPTEPAKKAIADAKAARAIDPEYPEADMILAGAHFSLGQYEADQGRDPRDLFGEALREFTAHLMKFPEDYFGHTNLGTVHMNIAQYEAARGLDPYPSFAKALAGMTKALEINPAYNTALTNRGNVYFHRGFYEKKAGKDSRASFKAALSDYEGALKRNPEDLSVLSNRGAAHYNLFWAERRMGADATDILEKAVADYDAILEKSPNYPGAYYNRGMAFLGLGKEGRAVDPVKMLARAANDFHKALARKPGDLKLVEQRGIATMHLATAYARAKKDPRKTCRKALESFDRVLEAKPDHHLLRAERACVRSMLGYFRAVWGLESRDEYRSALEDYRAVLKAMPGLWQARGNLGMHFDRQGRFRDALACYREAMNTGGQATAPFQHAVRIATTLDTAAPWNRDLGKADDALSAKKYGEARDLYEKVLAEAEKEGAGKNPMIVFILRYVNMNFARALARSAAMEGVAEEEKAASLEKAL